MLCCTCSYPHALYFLDLLQTTEFRAKIGNPAYKELVHTQQASTWEEHGAEQRRPCLGCSAVPPGCVLLHYQPPSQGCLPAIPSSQFYFWQHGRANRVREKLEHHMAAAAGGAEPTAAEAQAASKQQQQQQQQPQQHGLQPQQPG